MSHSVDGLPRNDHRHDSGLSCAGGQLQRQTNQFRIGFVVGIGKMLNELLASFACLRSYLGQPNEGLNCFDLAKERPNTAKSMVPPVLKQAGCFRSNLPVAGVWPASPLVYVAAKLIDDWCRVILLSFC